MFQSTNVVAIVILLGNLVSGPFTHLHDHDGAHGFYNAAIIHSHLPPAPPVVTGHDRSTHIELPSEWHHGKAVEPLAIDLHSIDVQFLDIDTVGITIALPVIHAPVVLTVVRSHDPPLSRLTLPRSPPLTHTA